MKQKKIIFIAALVTLAVALIVMGLSRVLWVYRNYRADMLTYESRHLNSIVSAVARGMDWMLNDYSTQVAQLMNRREFTRAEEEYASSGDAETLQKLMKRPDIIPPYTELRMSCGIAIYDGGGAFIAATSESFPHAAADEDLGGGILLRTDDTGIFWFVFEKTSDTGLRYELAVPVQALFSYHADFARVGRHGYLFLLEKNSRFICYAGEGQSVTESVSVLLEEHPQADPTALETLSRRGIKMPEDYEIYRYPWPIFSDDGAAAEETLVMTYPLSAGNGQLTMGAAMSFREFDSFLSDTLQEVTVIILLELGGAMILMFIVAWALLASRRNVLELQAMREKAGLMEEINRQQQSLAHTERLQQLGIMTSGMVHEFNNMLTPIMSQSLLLLEQIADHENSPQFENALDIYEASESARDILLRISSMSKKDVDMGFKSIELCALLEKTMNLASMAKNPHISQQLKLPEEVLFISGNDQLLTQAFLNLMINACQAMGDEGTLFVAAEKESRSSSGLGYVRVEVCDTGPGIPDENLGSIYDPFYTTKGERGTGLGLAICQKIIETHKGTITAANRPDGGAVFTVRIPLSPLPED